MKIQASLVLSIENQEENLGLIFFLVVLLQLMYQIHKLVNASVIYSTIPSVEIPC